MKNPDFWFRRPLAARSPGLQVNKELVARAQERFRLPLAAGLLKARVRIHPHDWTVLRCMSKCIILIDFQTILDNTPQKPYYSIC